MDEDIILHSNVMNQRVMMIKNIIIVNFIMKVEITKILKNNKYPKIITTNDFNYVYAIKTIYLDNGLSQFKIYCDKYNLKFNLIQTKEIDYGDNGSSFVKDIVEINDEYLFLIETKKVDANIHSCITKEIRVKKNKIDDFVIHQTNKIPYDDYLISKIFEKRKMMSKIEIDEERPNYFWGKYLFEFFDENDIPYKPMFDNIVDYDHDKGHLIHYFEKLADHCLIVFSIRCVCDVDKTKYFYKNYVSVSNDLKYFYNTKEITFTNNLTDAKWYSYPEIFKRDGKYYMLICQDDFGQKKETLLGEITFDDE